MGSRWFYGPSKSFQILYPIISLSADDLMSKYVEVSSGDGRYVTIRELLHSPFDILLVRGTRKRKQESRGNGVIYFGKPGK